MRSLPSSVFTKWVQQHQGCLSEYWMHSEGGAWWRGEKDVYQLSTTYMCLGPHVYYMCAIQRVRSQSVEVWVVQGLRSKVQMASVIAGISMLHHLCTGHESINVFVVQIMEQAWEAGRCWNTAHHYICASFICVSPWCVLHVCIKVL